MQESAPIQESWNKKRIILFLFIILILLAIGFAIKNFVLKSNVPLNDALVKSAGLVKGTSTEEQNPNKEEKNSLPVQSIIEDRINEIRKEVNTLNVSDVASSSPQVQKVLNDLKSLENYPKNQAKDICLNLCNNL